MSSSICPHFTQNAWKKDLCSNCFKSKDEHKQAAAIAASHAMGKSFSFSSSKKSTSSSSLAPKTEAVNKKTDYPNKYKTPTKSIIKKKQSITKSANKSKSHKVSFPKNLSEVIGYGGEWSENDSDDDDHDFMNLANERDENAATSTDDEETLELKRITRANTDFNMNNGNLLGDPQENIKKSFAALKLGAPQVDKEGKKQTLKISVVPFGATGSSPATADSVRQIFSTNSKGRFDTKTEVEVGTRKVSDNATTRQQPTVVMSSIKKPSFSTITSPLSTTTGSKVATSVASSAQLKSVTPNDNDGKNSPPIERAMEKSLLDEISETLEQKQNESKKLNAEKEKEADAATSPNSKVKFEITSLAESLDNKPFLDLKKPIARNPPITKDHAKPKINVFHKYSDSDSNCSDAENGVSAYYDVVETQISYENLPDGKCIAPETVQSNAQPDSSSSMFSNSQYITDMLLSSKTRAASYNLHEGNFMTSKITSDGLIVTKCSSDDALDSTGSSFDGSSDEETSYNMTRSESDSGIGISIGNEYKNVNVIEKERERQRIEKKFSASTNNSDYEDIQVTDQKPISSKVEASTSRKLANLRKPTFSLDKSRELHGEPDGSADPDGSLEQKEQTAQVQLPALPKSPPPTKTIDARPSFLHGLQKQHPPILLKKPDLPVKPLVVSPVNSPLKTFVSKRQPSNVEQQVISQLQLVISRSNENLAAESKDDAKLKKGRAPNPPPEQKSSAPPTPERDYNIVVEFERVKDKTFETTTTIPEASGGTNEQPNISNHSQEQNSNVEAPAPNSFHSTKPGLDKNLSTTPSTNSSSGTTAPAPPSATSATMSAISNIYTRKLPTISVNVNSATKNSASPVIREKDKRERATINPKFRSLNTFVTQRNNAAKNFQLQTATSSLSLKQPMTPEPTPRNNNKNLSVSEECLTAAASSSKGYVTASSFDLSSNSGAADKKSTSSPQKTKSKFSIKKFLRMGASKTTDNLHKKEGIYSEICTGDESGVIGKPRLVIIHPIDINPTAVEVVKDITKTNDAVAAQTVAVVTAKPPAPPLRNTEGLRAHEINKPARPPPPKSAELRRKQKIGLSTTGQQTLDAIDAATSSGGSMKCKADNVYANLGEIRSSIAPRKPERTASMREREAQLELVRKRHAAQNHENVDTVSICSSNGENVLTEQQVPHIDSTTPILSPQLSSGRTSSLSAEGKPPSGSRTSTFERKKNEPKIASKLEIFENRATTPTSIASSTGTGTGTGTGTNESRPSSLKDSVRKINSTIDSYLKDKRDFENMYEFVKTAASPPPPPPSRPIDLAAAARPQRRVALYSDTASVASYTRSEYGPVRNYGLNGSLANIPRVISASYCGSEVGEFDIYSPYSYYGSEAGGDIATDINDSVWGIPSANKNRSKATNRLRMRKGRSVVHKNIEDNYTAVVVANHEALAQVLDQLQQTPIIPPALRPLANAINLRFEDFTMLDGAQAFVVGKKAFHAALWTTAPVTLALSADSNQLAGVGGELSQLSGGVCGVLNPITEFCDLVPSYHLPLMPSTEVTLLQATISVLPRLQLDTLQSIGSILKGKSQVLDKSNFNFRGSIPNLAAGLKDINSMRNVVSVQNLSTLNEGESMDTAAAQTPAEGGEQTTAAGTACMPAFDDVMTREVAFIMLQLVNGMKNLQAKAIEEMPLSLSNVVLSKDAENKDAQARLCVLQGNNNDEDEPMGTLCKCAHIALSEMLPLTKITPILADILLQERSESLSKIKSVLEFVLWGPSDVLLSGSTKEREMALQRWLDLERATVLHGLVRTRVELTVYDECHLMFLVRSNAKMMNDAAKIVCGYQQQQSPEQKE